MWSSYHYIACCKLMHNNHHCIITVIVVVSILNNPARNAHILPILAWPLQKPCDYINAVSTLSKKNLSFFPPTFLQIEQHHRIYSIWMCLRLHQSYLSSYTSSPICGERRWMDDDAGDAAVGGKQAGGWMVEYWVCI